MHRFSNIVLLIVAMLAFGCGGSNPSSPTDPQGAAAEAQAGDDALAAGNFQSANDHYRQALAKDPENAQANVGAALTELYLLQNDTEVSGILDQVPNLPLRTPPTTKLSRATLARSLGLGRPAYDPISNAALMGRWMLQGAEDPVRISDVQRVIRNKVLPKLQYAEALLNRVELHPNWRYLVPPAVTEEPDTLEIDLGEIYAIDAVLNGMQGWLGILIAYNFDGADQEPANPESLFTPGTDFGTLHPDGAFQLASARANFLVSKLRLDSGIAFINGETDDQANDVIPQAALTEHDFLEFMDAFGQVQTSLAEPVEIEVHNYQDQPMMIDIEIGNFFTNAIADWKTKLPAHTFVEGEPRITNPINFPDPTFNGIFPDMTNELWYQLIGPVGPPPTLITARR